MWRGTPKNPINHWIKNMSGPMPPLQTAEMGGKQYYQTWMCQPHKEKIFACHVIYRESRNPEEEYIQAYIYGRLNAEQRQYLKTGFK
ncbi:Ivy family c-type lysozyme inhibitor [Neisseria wadsworthii]|nr:Ivy family c-type lysozyme inhibitor [Neisseria wadsworthii]QMT35167.1 hypothetical protein H3L96_08885 [Neisseria wadsworthii]